MANDVQCLYIVNYISPRVLFDVNKSFFTYDEIDGYNVIPILGAFKTPVYGHDYMGKYVVVIS